MLTYIKGIYSLKDSKFVKKCVVMARLTEYNYDLCVEICDKVADGLNIMDILESNDNYPSWSTFRRWKNDN